MDIILFGIQGSGKGTQGKLLAERYHLHVFDMGSQLRSIIESGTELGNKIKTIVEGGHLVDDDTVVEIAESFLRGISPDQSVLFDGIPRTQTQSEKLEALLKKYQRDVFALLIELSQETAIKRLTERRICPTCKAIYPGFYKQDVCADDQTPLVIRQDDSDLESVKQRLSHYENETKPVIQHFYDIDRLIKVDGEQIIPDVTEEMIEKAAYLFT
ncbi:hypothetical protein COY07_05365 [Candidatus Peregrinibacteria bacterium CG_4_10_14_0_2_um_filter_43_11]|nr:MAG: hypothetical protein COY07_05365 [Candidatus Peregrinibacteria bacterium CG_4_10_14_0_2_um_filter_43_11]